MTRKGWLLFIAISIIWGIPYLFIKIAVRELDPAVVVFIRVALAALVLIPIALYSKMFQHLRGHWLILILFAFIHMVGPFLLITYGELHISSSLTALLIASNPLMVAVIALFFFKSERVDGPRLIGLLVGMVGLVVLLGFDVGGDGQLWLGATFVILAAAGYAIGPLLRNHTSITRLPSLAVATAECSITTIVLLPVTVLRFPTSMPSLDVIVSLLILGLLCTAIALVIFFALIAEVGASRSVVITYVNPAVSVILGVTILSESFTLATVIGFLLIIAGSWLSTTSSIPRFLTRYLPRKKTEPETSHPETAVESGKGGD